MPNLDDPIITLGGLFVAGNRAKQFTGGETGRGLLAGGFAASSSNAVAQKARNAAGIDSSLVSDELARALLGAAVSEYGDMIPQNKAMARGIHYDVAQTGFKDAGLTLGDMLDGVGGGGSTATQAAPSPSPAQHSQPAMHTGGGAKVY